MRLLEDLQEDEPESLARITSLCPRPHSANSPISNEASAQRSAIVSWAGRALERARAHQRDDRSG